MADNSPKRHRAGSLAPSETDESIPCSKRHKPYNNILNLLDQDEEEEADAEPSHDLSAIFATLQQELSSSPDTITTSFGFESLPPKAELDVVPLPDSVGCGGEGDDESLKSVMRHLLEASDDELGIPNTGDENGVEDFNLVEDLPFAFSDHGLWELEDVAANYYTVLQSQLFM